MSIDETLNAYDAEIGSRIRQRRKEKGLTQSQLGAAIGVSFQQVQKYETGTNRVASSTLIALARVLDVKPSALIDDLATEEGSSAVASPEMELGRLFIQQTHGPAIARGVLTLSAKDEALVASVVARLAKAA